MRSEPRRPTATERRGEAEAQGGWASAKVLLDCALANQRGSIHHVLQSSGGIEPSTRRLTPRDGLWLQDIAIEQASINAV